MPKKPAPNSPRNYFTQDTENAIIEYVACSDDYTRNKIYNDRIRYGFYKLAENIIHTYKFYYTDNNSIEELKHQVITFLLEKLPLYQAGKGKAYSYFGTIAKRYLILYNTKNYNKVKDAAGEEELESSQEVLDIPVAEEKLGDLIEFMDLFVKYMDKKLHKHFPKDEEYKIAGCLVDLFRRRESLEVINKKAIFIYLREMLGEDFKTTSITKTIKRLKRLYTILFNEYCREGYIVI